MWLVKSNIFVLLLTNPVVAVQLHLLMLLSLYTIQVFFPILSEWCHLHYKLIFMFTWNCFQSFCSTGSNALTFLSTILFQILQMMVRLSILEEPNHSLFSKYSELLLLFYDCHISGKKSWWYFAQNCINYINH